MSVPERSEEWKGMETNVRVSVYVNVCVTKGNDKSISLERPRLERAGNGPD